MKKYNVIDGQNFFDQPVKFKLMKYDSIWKIATGQRDDRTTGCLIDYYLFNYLKTIIKW